MRNVVLAFGLLLSLGAGSAEAHSSHSSGGFPPCTASYCEPAPFTYYQPNGAYRTYYPYYRQSRRFSVSVNFNGQALYGGSFGGYRGWGGYGGASFIDLNKYRIRPLYPVLYY